MRFFERSLLFLMSCVLSFLCLLVAYQVLSRYIPFVPTFPWTGEASRGLLVWLVMLGSGYGFLKKEHFIMSAAIDSLAPAKGRIMHIIVDIVVLVCGVVITLSGIEFVERGWGRISFASGLPLVWVYSALVVGGILMMIGALASIRSDLMGAKGEFYMSASGRANK